MPLTDIEREISKAVVHRFINDGDLTSRRSLLRKFKGALPQALERLVSLSVLNNVGNSNEEFLPRAAAFQYCGDEEAQRTGKRSVEVVLRALRTLFEQELEQGEQKEYTPANVEAAARGQNAEIKAVTIRVGLYLAQEFGVFAGVRQSSPQTAIESVRVGEQVLTIGDIDRVWEEHIRLNSLRIEQEASTRFPIEATPLPASRKQPISEIQGQPFSSERPIKTLAEDELGRTEFAQAIAKIVGQWSGRDSLVLAIYGPWGSGKTSLKNMVLDALGKQGARTFSMEFNPWEWAGQEKVFEGFFGELSSNLGSVDLSRQAADAAKKMRMYAAMLSAGASITGSGRWLLVGFLGTVAFFGLAPLFQSPGLVVALKVVGSLALVLALALASLGKLADNVAGATTFWSLSMILIALRLMRSGWCSSSLKLMRISQTWCICFSSREIPLRGRSDELAKPERWMGPSSCKRLSRLASTFRS